MQPIFSPKALILSNTCWNLGAHPAVVELGFIYQCQFFSDGRQAFFRYREIFQDIVLPYLNRGDFMARRHIPDMISLNPAGDGIRQLFIGQISLIPPLVRQSRIR